MTIGTAVAAIAAVVAFLVSRPRDHPDFLFFFLVAFEFVLPFYLFLRLGDPKSLAEVLAIVMGCSYLACCAMTSPWYYPPYRAMPTAAHGMDDMLCPLFHGCEPWLYGEFWAEVRRWNWGLIVLLYAGLFTEAVLLGGSKRDSADSDVGPPKSPELDSQVEARIACIALAITLGALLAIYASWSGWLSWAGIVSLWLLLSWAGIVSFWLLAVLKRRGSLAWWRPWLFAVRLTLLVPALGTGLLLGLVWSWYGWRLGTGFVLLFMLLATLRLRSADSQRRSRIWFLALAIYWGFAVSVQLVEPSTLDAARGPTVRLGEVIRRLPATHP